MALLQKGTGGPAREGCARKEQWTHNLLERDALAFGVEIERSSEEWVREWEEELRLVRVWAPNWKACFF